MISVQIIWKKLWLLIKDKSYKIKFKIIIKKIKEQELK
jgi:hypothetical protein